MTSDQTLSAMYGPGARDLHVRMFVEKPLRPEVLRDVLSVLA